MPQGLPPLQDYWALHWLALCIKSWVGGEAIVGGYVHRRVRWGDEMMGRKTARRMHGEKWCRKWCQGALLGLAASYDVAIIEGGLGSA